MEELIKTWLKKNGSFEMGKALYLQYGTNRRLIAHLHQTYQGNKRIMADLKYEFQKMVPEEEETLDDIQIMSIEDFLTQKPIDLSSPSPDQAEFKRKKTQKTILQPKIYRPYVSPSLAQSGELDKKEDLERRNAFLYNQRGILSNRLKPTKGNPAIIAENAKIIDDIEAIVNEMKENRAKIRNSGKTLEPVETKDKILVYMQDVNYTEDELKSMSYEDILTLREKLRQQLAKAKKRAQTAKTVNGKKANEVKVKVKERELEIVDAIKKEIKEYEKVS